MIVAFRSDHDEFPEQLGCGVRIQLRRRPIFKVAGSNSTTIGSFLRQHQTRLLLSASERLAKTGGKEPTMNNRVMLLIAVPLLAALLGCSAPLTTREKGAGIGALGGAAAGGAIGAAVGHPGAGAAIGGVLGLGSGALIGDQLQGREMEQERQQRQIDENQAELERQRQEIERLKQQREY